MSRIERLKSVPLYAQVRDALADDIRRGVYRRGALLPSEEQLRQQMQVSRLTLRKALDELADRGVIRKVHGVGTYVSEPAHVRQMTNRNVIGFFDDMARQGKAVTSKILSNATIPANERIAAALALPAGAPVHCMERLRSVDAIPVSLQWSYVPADLVPKVADDYLTHGSLYRFLQEDCKIELIGTSVTILAHNLTAREAALLNVPARQAVIFARKITKGRCGAEFRDVEYDEVYYLPEHYQFQVHANALKS